jgi:Domain of unknown function (DUF6046)
MTGNRVLLENLLMKQVLPTLPPYQQNKDVVVARIKADITAKTDQQLADEIRYSMFGKPMAMPLILQLPTVNAQEWLLPLEPFITLSGGNVIARRTVAKAQFKGTIKERWSQDDYSIQIEGMLQGKTDMEYPHDDVEKLRKFCTARTAIKVLCPILALFEINQIVIEKWDIPFTKGENMQGYTIQAYSDDSYKLLIEEE